MGTPALCWFLPPSSSNDQNWSLPPDLVTDHGNNLFGVDYHVLRKKILLPSMINLYQVIQKVTIGFEYSNEDVVIAVAIPEGPFLPISILALHLLNLLTVKEKNYRPVILPLDPYDGVERLCDMIQDAKPLIILHIQPIFETELAKKLHTKPNSHLPKFIDFQKLLEQKVQPLYNSTINFESLIGDDLDPSTAIHVITSSKRPVMSHIVYTSGTSAAPKGTISSMRSLLKYAEAKNESHGISQFSRVLLASSLSFDPCLSDIIATYHANACLCFCTKDILTMHLRLILNVLSVTHVLSTPSLWNSVDQNKANHHTLDTLRVVALGGEPISSSIVKRWARERTGENKSRLLITYGVTEGCVYQTIGELFLNEPHFNHLGYFIGEPIKGMKMSIWPETEQSIADYGNNENGKAFEEVEINKMGEIVISGDQLDELSGYLNMPDLTNQKFVKMNDGKIYYRTGDRGAMTADKAFFISGRIRGEEGMVKINGVRLELQEIEHAIVDDCTDNNNLVLGCLATVLTTSDNYNTDDEEVSFSERKRIVAYCVLSDQCLAEIGIVKESSVKGYICTGPLLTVLRRRCMSKLRPECIPSIFVIIDRFPLTRTGKQDKSALPDIKECDQLASYYSEQPLRQYGRCGLPLSNILIECLNLQPNQIKLLSTTVSFGMIGGDSLTSTVVLRTLYALHHKVKNSRTLGDNQFGTFDGPFNVAHLLTAPTLGHYVDFLDKHGILITEAGCDEDDVYNKVSDVSQQELNYNGVDLNKISLDFTQEQPLLNVSTILYNDLIESITRSQCTIAVALLSAGADPNFSDDGRRLGKLKGGNLSKRMNLTSGPLHLAAVVGNKNIVKALIDHGCKANRPDANGQFPIHLVCSNLSSRSSTEEALERLKCVKLLLDAGKSPLTMKNGSQQTVLHCAARSGNCAVLSFLLDAWEKDDTITPNRTWGSKFDLLDRWQRSPVHWAVLNRNLDALQLLLKYGCDPSPPICTNNNRSSITSETPLQIVERQLKNNNSLDEEDEIAPLMMKELRAKIKERSSVI